MYPNSDPGMFWVAFYGCLLAEVIPVPIEVPLSRKVRKLSEEHVNLYSLLQLHACVTVHFLYILCRMQVSARWGSCWAAVVLVSLSPVRSV